MAKNRGKKFEEIIGDSFRNIPNVSVDRLADQTMRYKGRTNVSDFIVFKRPYQYYVECKTVHGNRLPLSNISQMDALLEKSYISGVKAGVLCWWVDKDVTRWIPIESLVYWYSGKIKSIRYDDFIPGSKEIIGIKRKVYFDYDMTSFFE